MKRITAFLLAALLTAVMLVSCGAQGKYVVKTVGGEPVEDYLEECKEYGFEYTAEEYFSIELKSGYKAVVTMLGEEKEGTWEQSGKKISVTVGEETKEFTLKGDELTGENSGNSSVLKKK